MRMLPTLAAPLALGVAGCTAMDAASTATVGQAQLTFADGRPAGIATLLSDARGVSVRVNATGLTPGDHGFHLHTIGKCEAPAFTSAGGHLNPGARKHGTLAQGGAHLGDLPNLRIAANGTGSTTEPVAGNRASLDAIFDTDGTAIIIHADADDYRTDPTGNAGDRVACGVFSRST